MTCEVTVYDADMRELGVALADMIWAAGRGYVRPVRVLVVRSGSVARVSFRITELQVTFYPGLPELGDLKLRHGSTVSFDFNGTPAITISINDDARYI